MGAVQQVMYPQKIASSGAEMELITAWPSPSGTLTQSFLGYTFTPSSNITATQLGHRRHGSQTGVITIELRVWVSNGTPGTLLATATGVDVGSVANGACAYSAITPVALSSGTKYYIIHPDDGVSLEDQYATAATTAPDLSQQSGCYSGPTEDGGTSYYAEHNIKYTKP